MFSCVGLGSQVSMQTSGNDLKIVMLLGDRIGPKIVEKSVNDRRCRAESSTGIRSAAVWSFSRYAVRCLDEIHEEMLSDPDIR